jgi:hypothetical protein
MDRRVRVTFEALVSASTTDDTIRRRVRQFGGGHPFAQVEPTVVVKDVEPGTPTLVDDEATTPHTRG